LTVSLHFLLYIAYRTNIVSTEYEYSNKNCVFASDLVAVSSGGCITGRLVRDDQPADDGLGKDIKDGVGVSFTLHGDDTNLLDRSGTKSATVSLGSLSGVAARAGRAVDSSEDPDNGVANPGEERKIDNVAKKFQDGARIAATAASSASGGFFSDFGEEVHDGEESKHGEAEESPLFVASDEFADEAGNNHEVETLLQFFGQCCQTLLFYIPDELLTMEVENLLDVQFGHEDANRHRIVVHLGVDLGQVDATNASAILPFHHSIFISFKSVTVCCCSRDFRRQLTATFCYYFLVDLLSGD